MRQAILLYFFLGLVAWLSTVSVRAEDPYRYFTFEFTYGQIAPLGVKQRVRVAAALSCLQCLNADIYVYYLSSIVFLLRN